MLQNNNFRVRFRCINVIYLTGKNSTYRNHLHKFDEIFTRFINPDPNNI